MENQSDVNSSGSISANESSANTSSNTVLPKTNLLPILLTFLISGVIFGSLGFVAGKQQNQNTSLVISDTRKDKVTTTLPSPTSSLETTSCKTMNGLADYIFCKDPSRMNDYIIGPYSIKIEHVSNYTVSPNKEWLFVVRYSDNFAKTGGAPAENALTMVDINNAKATELFTQIYYPNYAENSWSSQGNGIVFTAGGATVPDILGNPNMFAVVYCTTSCRVLAKNAGPAGIGGDPAYFVNGKVHYTGMNNESVEIPFN